MLAHGDKAVLLIAPRLAVPVLSPDGAPPAGLARTALVLPEPFAKASARCVFSGRIVPLRGRIDLASLTALPLPLIALVLDRAAA
jgi:hypothetical protein